MDFHRKDIQVVSIHEVTEEDIQKGKVVHIKGGLIRIVELIIIMESINN